MISPMVSSSPEDCFLGVEVLIFFVFFVFGDLEGDGGVKELFLIFFIGGESLLEVA